MENMFCQNIHDKDANADMLWWEKQNAAASYTVRLFLDNPIKEEEVTPGKFGKVHTVERVQYTLFEIDRIEKGPNTCYHGFSNLLRGCVKIPSYYSSSGVDLSYYTQYFAVVEAKDNFGKTIAKNVIEFDKLPYDQRDEKLAAVLKRLD